MDKLVSSKIFLSRKSTDHSCQVSVTIPLILFVKKTKANINPLRWDINTPLTLIILASGHQIGLHGDLPVLTQEREASVMY